MPNPNLSLVQNNILSLLMANDDPMTMSEMARRLNVTFQTVSNHMHALRAQSLVVESHRVGNAMKYKLGDPSSSLLQIVWNDETIPVAQMMKDYASGKSPVADLPNVARGVVRMFARLYLKCAENLDDPNKTITIGQMKTYQAEIVGLRNSLRSMLKTFDSMLDNTKLWDPREIVTELMIRDEEMDPQMAKRIYSNIINTIGDANNG